MAYGTPTLLETASQAGVWVGNLAFFLASTVLAMGIAMLPTYLTVKLSGMQIKGQNAEEGYYLCMFFPAAFALVVHAIMMGVFMDSYSIAYPEVLVHVLVTLSVISAGFLGIALMVVFAVRAVKSVFPSDEKSETSGDKSQ